VRSQPRNNFCREGPKLSDAGRQQHRPLPDGTQPGDELTEVLVRGALEEDDPETWDTRELGWAPKAEDKGDRSLGPNAKRESESSVVAAKRGNE
jgi:hypothetical protein